jgi:hypothetical protein
MHCTDGHMLTRRFWLDWGRIRAGIPGCQG